MKKKTSKIIKTTLAKNVDEYLSLLPEDIRPVLEKLRQTIKSAAPQAEEVISYQIPTYKYHGPVVHFMARKNHCSLVVISKTILEKFSIELQPFNISGRTIHFTPAKPIPEKLVKKIVKARIKENELLAQTKKTTLPKKDSQNLFTYVAFLRGINVGGKNIIKMEALRAEFEKIGFQSVKTYIQSGNIIFQSNMTDQKKIEKLIEAKLAKALKYQVKVLIRSAKELENVTKNFPKIFSHPDWKHNIIFLSDKINSKNILKKFQLKDDIEENSYFNGTLYWSARWDKITRSTMLKLSAKPEYQEMTVRNINTVKKIFELMEKV